MTDHAEVKATLEALSDLNPDLSAAELTGHLAYIFSDQERTMIAWIKHYAKGIVAGIGYVASIATALGLQHQHYIAVILGVLSTIAVILTRNTADAAGKPAAR